MNLEQKLNFYKSLGTVGSANFSVETLVSQWTNQGWSMEAIVKALQQLDMQ